MRGGDTEVPEERVRRALAQLGTDADSAPDVPPAVMARIGAALRAAPPPAHASGRPQMNRLRVIALVLGIGAAAALLAVGIAAALHTAPAPRFPSGPTAEKITVSKMPAETPKPVVTRP